MIWLSFACQLDGRKNLVEIELNESLRRRQRELQVKLESLGEATSGNDTSTESLDARKRELRSLGISITAATKRSQGMCSVASSFIRPHAMHTRRRRQRCRETQHGAPRAAFSFGKWATATIGRQSKRDETAKEHRTVPCQEADVDGTQRRVQSQHS